MAPTEYRLIAKRAGRARFPACAGWSRPARRSTPACWRLADATGLSIRDGYGQTETGQLTAIPLGEPARPGSMGRPLPGVGLEVVDGELVLDPRSDPTFFFGYLGEPAGGGPLAHGRPRARRRRRLPVLRGPRRRRDRLRRLPDRALRGRVGAAAHAAVAEAAVVAAPDDERGSVVRAVVVLRDGPPSARSRASFRST